MKNIDNRADYAEMFEAVPEFAGAKIPRGTSVVFVGDKIRPALPGEVPFGVISSFPIMLGNNAKSKEWTGKYLKDDFGNFIEEEVEIWVLDKNKEFAERGRALQARYRSETGKKVPNAKKVLEIVEEGKTLKAEVDEYKVKLRNSKVPRADKLFGFVRDGGVPEGAIVRKKMMPRLNPEYDPSKEYTPRAKRNEWNMVGLLGKLKVLKGQPVAPSWIFLAEVSETVDEYLVK